MKVKEKQSPNGVSPIFAIAMQAALSPLPARFLPTGRNQVYNYQ